MLKRGAGEHGRREDEAGFAMQSTPDEKPQRATAAQMANRKIKDVRRRPRGTTPTSGVGGSQASDTFSSISSAPSFQGSSFSAPSTQPGGFSFGQSQSFPGANSGPTQPAQSGSTPFSFGGNGQTGFNFSSGLDSPSSNPFAASSFNSVPSQPASTGFSFTGFGSQSTSQPPSFSFGGQPPATTTSGPSMFGQATTATPAADSMQISPAKPKVPSFDASASFASRNIFGGDNATPNVFGQKPAASGSNPFGTLNVPSTADKPSSDKAEGFAAKPAFATQTPSTPTPAQPFGGLFGATPTASKPAEPEKANAAPTTSTPAQPFGGLFGATPVSKSADADKANAVSSTPTAAQPFGSLFGATPTTSKPAEPEKGTAAPLTSTPAQPFAGLFGATPAASKAPDSEKTNATPATSAPAQPFGSLFGAKPTTSTSEAGSLTASQPATNNIFSAQTSAAQSTSTSAFSSKGSEQASFNNPFAPKPASDQTPSTDSQPAKPLFGAPASSQPGTTDVPTPKPAGAQNPFGNLFGPKPATESTGDSSQPPSAGLFSSKPADTPFTATPKPSFTMSPFKPAGEQPPTSNLFAPKPAVDAKTAESQPSATQLSTTPTKQPPSQMSGGIFGSGQAISQPKPSQAPSGTSSDFGSIREQMNKVPMPDLSDLSPGVREEAELLWKIRTLNMGFKAEVATYDPEGHDFDKLILFYMKVREALGRPVEGHKKSKDTSQKQPTQENGHLHKTAKADRPREPESATSALFAKSFAASTSKPAKQDNVATPAKDTSASTSTPTPKASENPFKSLSTGITTSSSVTTNGLSETAAKPAGSALGGNMFAKSTSNAQGSAPLGGNMFAKSTSASQTSAPPTAPPKFGNGGSGVDFMAQFKKKADETAAKEKAKRKAEDFDSEEDDEEEWERRDAEKQREKRAKLEGSKKKTVWDGKGFKIIDDDNSTEESPAPLALPAPDKAPAPSASPAPSSTSIFESSSRPLTKSENIFGHLPASAKPADDSDESENEGQPRSPKRALESNEESESKAALRKSKRAKSSEAAEATKSSLDTPIPAPTAAAGRSLFDRVESTTPQNDTPAAAPANPFAAALGKNSLFPSSTTSSAPGSMSIFGQPAATDHTWKPNSPIKFSTSSSAAPTESSVTSTAPSTAGNATPEEGTEDGEAAPGAIFDLSHGNAGEEEEKVVFECRARAFKLVKGWTCQGTGIARLLQHPSGRARIVLRAEPSGQVVLNALLKKELEYARANNSVQFMVPQADGAPEHWAIRLKADLVQSFHDKVKEIKN